MKAVFQFIARRPWIYVVLAFVLLLGAWIGIFFVAARAPTPEFELPPTPHHR